MSKLHCHLDPVGGIAGDMFCAAMLSSFPLLASDMQEDLAAAGVLTHVQIDLSSAMVNGISAKHITVTPTQSNQRPTGDYQQIRQWLLDCAMEPMITNIAVGIFDHLAQAEAQVHNVPIDKVHFHEVADWDSIADIVGASSLIYRSDVNSWSCGSLPMGGGLVQTEHGQLPVPAPAAAILLQGFALHDDGQIGERVTPTGAAILRYLIPAEPPPRPTGTLRASGAGCGTRRFAGLPNILRALVIEFESDADYEPQEDIVSVLSFELDDMTPEELATSLEHIRAGAGVLDVSYQVRFGKKGRSQFAVQVIGLQERSTDIANLCLTETSTLGVRLVEQQRRVLARQAASINIDEKSMPIKRASRPDGTTTVKVEADSLREIPGLAARRRISAAASPDAEPFSD